MSAEQGAAFDSCPTDVHEHGINYPIGRKRSDGHSTASLQSALPALLGRLPFAKVVGLDFAGGYVRSLLALQ